MERHHYTHSSSSKLLFCELPSLSPSFSSRTDSRVCAMRSFFLLRFLRQLLEVSMESSLEISSRSFSMMGRGLVALVDSALVSLEETFQLVNTQNSTFWLLLRRRSRQNTTMPAPASRHTTTSTMIIASWVSSRRRRGGRAAEVSAIFKQYRAQSAQYILDLSGRMATRHTHAHTHDKENAGELPPFKSGKIAGKEGVKEGKQAKHEGLILGSMEEELGDGQLLAAKRRMKQGTVGDFVLRVQACWGGEEGGV